ncbi:hypothetical protein A33Q_3769 [Indibacter alkaliphilus LW1]|uniref:Outer membrane protein beta-barrel domain-containing protein n=2 Tax=Indibacter TaxID=647744 RepID=S2D2U0_INDAL|nr:hypothetical protein A33Q_3769 [Indibacter alkaliphilus LW1]
MIAKMMKTLNLASVVLFFLITFFSLQTHAQKNNWGISAEFGSSSVEGRDFIGGPSFHPREYFAFGFTYIRAISPKFDFETGLTYSRTRILERGGGTPYFPDIIEFNIYENMLTVPFYLKWNVSPRIFLNGGPNMSWNRGENTYDAGYGFGIGYQWRIKENKKLLINPMYQARGARPQEGRGVQHLGLRLVFVVSP